MTTPCPKRPLLDTQRYLVRQSTLTSPIDRSRLRRAYGRQLLGTLEGQRECIVVRILFLPSPSVSQAQRKHTRFFTYGNFQAM